MADIGYWMDNFTNLGDGAAVGSIRVQMLLDLDKQLFNYLKGNKKKFKYVKNRKLTVHRRFMFLQQQFVNLFTL